MSKCIKCGNEILTGDIHWEMGLCNNCYNELYKDHKTHISLDKMWLEIAQSFRDENEKLQDKVADLEAKLAESEIRSKESEIFYKREINRRDIKLRNIKQQLAEKEKEIIKDKINLLEFLKVNFADVYINGVMKIDCYDRVKYSKDVDSIIDREISKLKGEW